MPKVIRAEVQITAYIDWYPEDFETPEEWEHFRAMMLTDQTFAKDKVMENDDLLEESIADKIAERVTLRSRK